VNGSRVFEIAAGEVPAIVVIDQTSNRFFKLPNATELETVEKWVEQFANDFSHVPSFSLPQPSKMSWLSWYQANSKEVWDVVRMTLMVTIPIGCAIVFIAVKCLNKSELQKQRTKIDKAD
jgi:hypothetical protein